MDKDQQDRFYQSQNFQDFFRLSKQSLVLKADPPAFTVMAVSDHCLKITHGLREQILGRPLFEAYPGDGIDQKLVSDSFQRVIDSGKPDILPVFKYEIYVAETGEYETLYWSNVNEPFFDEEGKVAYVINTTENVSDQMLIAQTLKKNVELEQTLAKQAIALQNSERLFERLIEQAPVAIALMNGPEFVVEVCNEKVLEIWGRTADQVMGKPVFEALPETAGQGFEQLLNGVLDTGVRAVIDEMPVSLYRNGKTESAWVNFIYEPIRSLDGEIKSIIVVCSEVTQQVRSKMELEELSKQKLAQSEQILYTAISSANLGTWYIDLDSGEFVASARLKELFGFEPEDQMGINDAMAQIAIEHREQVDQEIQLSIVQNTPFDMEYKVMGYRDKVSRWVRCTGRRYPADNSDHAYFAGTMLDITERKEMEQRKDDFISIASHELKTPITSLKAALQFLEKIKHNPGSPELPVMIDLASKSMTRVSTLVDDLLNAARMKEQRLMLNKTRFSIRSLIDNSCRYFRFKETGRLVVNGNQQLEIIADQLRLEQVIVNFLNNAVKYAPDSPKITITIDEPLAGEIKISVNDDGPGISNEKVKYLFDRYYRTERNYAQYSGLGLGLYISAQIIEEHEGRIGVDSRLGQGSSFWFTLPC